VRGTGVPKFPFRVPPGGVTDQYRLQTGGQRRQVIATVTGEYGIFFIEVFVRHEKAYGVVLGRTPGQYLEQADMPGYTASSSQP